MVFMHLEECPYCVRMLKENFVSGERRDWIQKHFDVIDVDIRGARELVWVDGVSHTERSLATQLKIVATPAIIIFDHEGNKVLHLNGYRDPRAFGQALDYVQAKHYRRESFPAYLMSRTNRRSTPFVRTRYSLRPRTSRATKNRSRCCSRTGSAWNVRHFTTRY